MATVVRLDRKDWDQLKADLLTVFTGEERQVVLRKGALAAARVLQRKVNNSLPPPTRRLPMKFTAKQRAWWWATIRAKARGLAPFALPGWKVNYETVTTTGGRTFKRLNISGAYKRSGTLIRSTSYKVETTQKRSTIIFGPNVPYAKFVVGDKGQQAKYHRGNWPQLPTLVWKMATPMALAFADVAQTEIEKKIGRS